MPALQPQQSYATYPHPLANMAGPHTWSYSSPVDPNSAPYAQANSGYFPPAPGGQLPMRDSLVPPSQNETAVTGTSGENSTVHVNRRSSTLDKGKVPTHHVLKQQAKPL